MPTGGYLLILFLSRKVKSDKIIGQAENRIENKHHRTNIISTNIVWDQLIILSREVYKIVHVIQQSVQNLHNA